MTRGIIFSALLCSAAMAFAANEAYTLDQCRQMAVDNNSAVAIANANAKAAKLDKDRAFTAYFPQVTADGMWFHSNKPVFHYDFFNTVTVQFLKKGVGANITALQPIFAGGRIVNTNRLAAVGVEAGELERANTIDNVELKAEQYYWQLATLKSQKLTLQSVITMVDTLAAHVGVAVKAGVTLPNELLKVKLRRSELESTMVDLDNGISLSSSLLAQYIGRNGEKIDITGFEAPQEVPQIPADLQVDPTTAMQATNDYKLLEAKVKAADLQTKITMADNLPTVAVGGGLFYDDLLNEKWSFGAVFVNVSIPISGWWGGSHAVKRSKLEAANARENLTDLSQMLSLKITDAWDNLTAAHRKMELAKEAITESTENLRLNRNYYNAGITTVTELLDAQTLYRQSLDNYTESYGAYRLCMAQYLDALK